MTPITHGPWRPPAAHRPASSGGGGGILSKSAFFQKYGARFGKPGSGAYTGYVNYRTNKPKQRAAARAGNAPGGGQQPFDPLAVLTDEQLRARAVAAVHAASAPVVAQLQTTYSNRGEEQAAQLAALTKMAVEAAGKYGPEVGAAYGGAQTDQAATDAALASLLHGGGVQAAGELAGQLGAGSPIAAGAGAIGTGAAGANLATGSADLTRLISQGAAAQDYGAKLPGIAASHGLDTASRMAADLDRQLQEAITGVTSQEPGQVQSLYENLANNRTSVALAKQSGLLDTQKATADYNYKTASLRERIAHDKAVEANAKATAEERRAARIDRENATAATRGDKKDALDRLDPAKSRVAGYWVNGRGDPILDSNGHRKPVASTKTPPGQKPAYTPQQRSSAFYTTRTKVFSEATALHAKKGTGSLHKGETRESAYAKLWNKYAVRLVSQYGYKRAAVKTMIEKALDTAGF